MRRLRRRALALLVAGGLVAAATSCDQSYSTLDAYGGGRPRCDGMPLWYAIHGGDFSAAQVQDIHAAVGDWRDAAGMDIRFAGFAPWRAGPEQPPSHISIEKRNVVDLQGITHGGYGYPGNDGNGFASAGVAWIGTAFDGLPSPTAPSLSSGPTFRGVALHELGHAILGLADMYDKDDGHPQLIMGKGYHAANTPMVGDRIGAAERGCRSAADKAVLVESLRKW